MNKYGIHEDWFKDGLDINLLNQVMEVILKKRKHCEILPSNENIFNAIKSVSPKEIKVIIIGQDPYPSSEHAHGLAFSSISKEHTPHSLKNIFKKLEQDFEGCTHKSNELTSWVNQGVLLLNTALTFESKDNKILREHTKLWKPVIDNIFEVIKKQKQTIIVMRWGNHAKVAGEVFENSSNFVIMDTTHPSPLSANRGFMTCNHFIKCNEILGKNAIDWNT